MDKGMQMAAKYMVMVILVLWIFYWAKLIPFATARSMTLGVIVGGVTGLLISRWLFRNRR